MELGHLTRLLREVRLRRVSDVAYRLYHGAVNRLGILRRRFPAVTPDETDFVTALEPGGPGTMGEFVEHFDSRCHPVFYFDHRDPADSPVAAGNGAKTPPALLEAAGRILQRRFSTLGGREVQFNGRVDWLHCLNGEARWPADRHWSQIDYRYAIDQGDVKTCWEWNRHHALVTLGRAYRYTGDERYVDEFVRLLDWWCQQNPPEMGVNYTSNLEIGLRCVSWLWAHHLIAPSEHYPPQCRARLHLFLYYMARHLARNLNYTVYTGRNNHLIGDASCLAVWCLMYPEVCESAAWLERALSLLWEALDEQLYPDGMHFELSFGYHQFALELFLQVVSLLRRNGRPVPPGVAGRLEQMTEVLATVIQPDGEAPNFNDNDGGFVWALHDSPRDRLNSLLEVAANVVNRPEFLPVTHFSPMEQAAWVLGNVARRSADENLPGRRTAFPGRRRTLTAWKGLPTGMSSSAGRSRSKSSIISRTHVLPRCERRPFATSFDHAGIFVMRSDRGDDAQFALINNHPDPFPNSGHNHASLLQLLLWIDGKPLLIDGGTYRYSDDSGWRNALRGTHAHNTVVVDGRDQAEPSRNFGWLSKLRPGNSRLEESDDFVIFDGYHDSYRRLPRPVRHRRSVIWIKQPGVWIVRDELTGKGTHTYQQMWHVPAHYRVTQVAPGLLHVDGDQGTVAGIQFLSQPGDRIDIVCGDRRRLWSWESARYGVVRPRRSIVLRWKAAVPTSRIAAFSPTGGFSENHLTVLQVGTNRLRIGNGPCEIDFSGAAIRCERKGASCEMTSCLSSGR
jgi:hypothetical protein